MAESRIDLASFLDRENDKITAATGGLVQLGGLARTETPALASKSSTAASSVKK